jgi:hypothetical protein
VIYAAYFAIMASGWALNLADARWDILRGNGNEVSWWMTATANVMGAIWRAAEGLWVSVGLYAVFAAICAWMALRERRRRKRRGRLAAIGAKSKARIAAMAARMRERPARPVLRPVHGGAR